MTVGDLNFPFPDPSFLFIHCVEIRPVLTRTSDPRGRPVVKRDLPQSLNGYLTAPDPNTDDSAGTQRIKVDAVLLIGNDCTYPTEDALVRSDDPQLPPRLAGTYRITTTRPNISHTRLLLERYDGKWEDDAD